MAIVYYIFAALLVYMSIRSLLSGLAYLRFFERETGPSDRSFAPFATVIAPCKGLEDGLRENLAAVLDQDYPAYEVVFVVDDISDPAVDVIREVIGGRSSTKLVVAPVAKDSSQKVENLREAGLHADPDSKIFVFVDSDARPARDWLQALVAPLADETIGAATGYRWFVANGRGLAAELRSVWNASIASSFGPNDSSNFCWGGATAIRREMFDAIDLREKWRGTVSDDFVVALELRRAGRGIRFVPKALTASRGDCTLSELLEFTNRQLKLTRVYMPLLWAMALIGSALFVGVMSASIAIIAASEDTVLRWAAACVVTAVLLLSVGKAWLRLRAVRLVLPETAHQLLPQLTLWPVSQFLFLINTLAALFSRRITWRGIDYLLVSPTATEVSSQTPERTRHPN